MFASMKFVLLSVIVIQGIEGLGDTFTRNQAIAFLSARSGWRIYEANSISVNPNLSIAPLLFSPSPNQRAVLVRYDPDPAVDPIPALATVGTSTTNYRNKHHIRTRGYDLDSVVITPGVDQTTPSNQTVPANPITLTFFPLLGHVFTGQCMVARINTGSSQSVVNDVITNIDVSGGNTCAIFVRNSTDTALLDSREIRRCEAVMRKCSRAFSRLGREQQVELTTLSP